MADCHISRSDASREGWRMRRDGRVTQLRKLRNEDRRARFVCFFFLGRLKARRAPVSCARVMRGKEDAKVQDELAKWASLETGKLVDSSHTAPAPDVL